MGVEFTVAHVAGSLAPPPVNPEMPSAHSDVVGIPVSSRPLGNVGAALAGRARNRAFTVTFVNPSACALARRVPEYPGLLRSFDQVCCDGSGMVLAAHAAGLEQVCRESFDFTSVAGPVFEWAAREGLGTGLVGGRPGVSAAVAKRLSGRYPRLSLTRPFAGFGEDVEEALDHHGKGGTPLVICGMGAPHQERFLVELVRRGWTGVGFTCGGFFDQLLSGERYYPDWIDRMNLRFLYRLYREPRRLWRRYLVDYQVFIWRLAGLTLRRATGKVRRGQANGGEVQ